MNWTSVLVDEKAKAGEDMPDDVELFGVVSGRGAQLEMLEYWLNKEFWNFDRGFCQFDGASEGHCILAGIEPENSMLTDEQYGPAFLPESIQFYGYSIITAEEQWRLKDAIDERISDLKSLGLKGRVHCHKALEICEKNKLDPPWLGAANDDFKCARRLPAGLRTNEEIKKRIGGEASSKGGSNRAKKNLKTQMLDHNCLQEFDKLRKNKFPDCWFMGRNGQPNAERIANKIYHALGQYVENSTTPLPEILTIAARVRKWLKNSSK